MVLSNFPYHIAIIPDGNRRFAKRLMKSPWKGHEWGTEKLKNVLEWCRGTGTRMVTFYSLSLENIEKRPKREIDYLYKISRNELKDIVDNKENFVHKNRAKLFFFGELEMLPEDIQKLIVKAQDATKDYDEYFVNLAIAYGGRQEIAKTIKNIAKRILNGDISSDDIDEELIENSLYTHGIPNPDLIIRTGGEKRLSNFLPVQSAYSELVFVDTLWPEMTKEEFISSIKDYLKRKRRFGS